MFRHRAAAAHETRRERETDEFARLLGIGECFAFNYCRDDQASRSRTAQCSRENPLSRREINERGETPHNRSG